MMNGLLVSLLAALVVPAAFAARCQGQTTPGPPNTNAILDDAPVFVRSIANGKLFRAGPSDGPIDIVHVFGSSYDMGFAYGTLLKPQMQQFFPEVKQYMIDQVTQSNSSFMRWVAKVGLDVALDLSYDVTKKYSGQHFFDEFRGVADATGIAYLDVRRVHYLAELTRGSCSMFGAWGSATQNSLNGNLLQLRALDWNMDGPFRNYPALIVYHPKSADGSLGHAFANLAFTGFSASVTGMSSKPLGISEIGVSMPDKTFGKETYLAPGYPFTYLLRDILQFDNTVGDAVKRITTAKRTCDLILGVGDGNSNEFRGFQYSPNVANVFDDTNMQPTEDWHPRIKDIVYWGMDWMCPNDNRMLSHQLQAYHGNLTAELAIRHVMPYVQTGDLHIALYDYSSMSMFVSYARPAQASGPDKAYQRPFVKLNMTTVFAETAEAQ